MQNPLSAAGHCLRLFVYRSDKLASLRGSRCTCHKLPTIDLPASRVLCQESVTQKLADDGTDCDAVYRCAGDLHACWGMFHYAAAQQYVLLQVATFCHKRRLS
jgi:tryptophan synthase beta subunit